MRSHSGEHPPPKLTQQLQFLYHLTRDICLQYGERDHGRSMDLQERIVRRLEDFVLAERGLDSVGDIRFQHEGEEQSAYPYIRALNSSFIHALQSLPAALQRHAGE
ncbi:MAG: hypothetical protein AAFU85_05165 [Planctomycetota bacterium]